MMDENREKLLREVMAAEFASFDLQLYLNTHPCDQRAINLYNCSVQKQKEVKDCYERMYGPISAHSLPSRCPWQWIEGPWPWEG